MDRIIAAIIKRSKGNEEQYLLMSTNVDYGPNTGFLQPAAGHKKENETDQECLVRKIKAELGVSCKVGSEIITSLGDLPNSTVSWYQCEVPVEAIKISDPLIRGVYWLTKDEIIKRVDVWPATKEFFIKLK